MPRVSAAEAEVDALVKKLGKAQLAKLLGGRAESTPRKKVTRRKVKRGKKAAAEAGE